MGNHRGAYVADQPDPAGLYWGFLSGIGLGLQLMIQ